MLPKRYTNGIPGHDWDLTQFDPHNGEEIEAMEDDVICVFRYLAINPTKIGDVWFFKHGGLTPSLTDQGKMADEALLKLSDAPSFILNVTRYFIILYRALALKSSLKASRQNNTVVPLAKLLKDFDFKRAETEKENEFIGALINTLPNISGMSAEGLENFKKLPEKPFEYGDHHKTEGGKPISVPFAAISVVAAALLIAALIVYFAVIAPMISYNNALKLVKNEEYYKASEIFTKLGDYKDSEARLEAISDKIFANIIEITEIGDVITYGTYEQNNITSDGEEALEWIILDEDENGRKLITTKYCIEAKKYDDNGNYVEWRESSLRKWLNGEFFNIAFSDEEKMLASAHSVENGDDGNTVDVVYIFSTEEAKLYTEHLSGNEPTDYVDAMVGIWNSVWTRSQANYERYNVIDRIYHNEVYTLSADTYEVCMIRPVMWVDPSLTANAETRYSYAVNLFIGGQYEASYGEFLTVAGHKNADEYIEKLPRIIATEDFRKASVGDDITFGALEFGDAAYDIPWTVLEKQEGKVLVVSKYALLRDDYHDYTLASPGWENCTLREYIAKDLAEDLFSFGQRSCILTANNNNPDNPTYGTEGGNATSDSLFLLDHEEIVKYFPDPIERKAYSLRDTTEAVTWWISTPGANGGMACIVEETGEISYEGESVIKFSSDTPYVRVAMWINTSLD